MARKFTRRRWRRPERLTLEHPPVVRRKDITVPDTLTLEPDLARQENRRRALTLSTAFLVLFAAELIAFALAFREWRIAFAAVAVLVFLAGEGAFADRWVRHAMGAHLLQAPRLERLVSKLAETVGVATPEIYVVAGERPNAIAFGVRKRWIAVTSGALELDDLPLEGMLAHELVHIRDGDAGFLARYVFLAGAPEVAIRGLGARGGVFAWLGLPLWPAALVIRFLPGWFPPDREHRADIAAALVTRYPPGVADALAAAEGAAPAGLGATAPWWFGPRDGRRAQLVGEM